MIENQIPKWADGGEDVAEFLMKAIGISANIPQNGPAGTGIHIGVFDSTCELSKDYHEGHEGIINGGKDRSFTEENHDYEVHGSDVFQRISTYSPKAEVSLYQVVDDEGKLSPQAFDRGITRAIDDGVDIVNISAGDPWPGPVDACPATRLVKDLIDEHITVVAAAGNWKEEQDDRPPVHCPAAHDDVIAVGGYETYCPAEPGTENDETPSGPYYLLSDGDHETLSPFNPTDKVFCGEQGCIDGDSCFSNQREKLWNRNPERTDGKPDTFAPMHLVRQTDDGLLYLELGTSFAAPLVTASLANIYSEIKSNGDQLPHPWKACQAVRNVSLNSDQWQIDRYDAMAMRGELELVD